MLIIIFLLYMCYHFVHKVKQFFLLHTKPHNVYFQRAACPELIMFFDIKRYRRKTLHASLRN